MTGDSQSVTQAQFLTAAKECLEAEKRVRSRDPEVLDVLQRMQEHLKYNTQQAYSTFVACDGGRGGAPGALRAAPFLQEGAAQAQ